MTYRQKWRESVRGSSAERRRWRAVATLLGAGPVLPLLLLTACDSGTAPGENDPRSAEPVSFAFDFGDTGHHFEAEFTDVAVAQAEGVGFDAGHRPLPAPLARNGLFQRGLNLSDDLFMFFRRRMVGLEPGRSYTVRLDVEIASQIHEGCDVGVGTSVVVKAGASRERPQRVVVYMNGRDEYRLSVDKGLQHHSGEAAVTLDDIRNGLPGCPHDGVWDHEIMVAGDHQIVVVADDEGGAWLFFGTESVWEVTHQLFFTRFRADFTPR